MNAPVPVALPAGLPWSSTMETVARGRLLPPPSPITLASIEATDMVVGSVDGATVTEALSFPVTAHQ
jgi:hypothetical protein